MSTLSNVDNQHNCLDSSGEGAKSFTFPAVHHSQNGVSVDYVQDLTKQQSWYVFRVTYNHEIQVADALIADGIYAYLATKKVDRFKQEQVFTQNVPLINLVFAFLTEEEARSYAFGDNKIPYATFYYNHFTKDESGYNPPLTIDEESMKNFILATQSQNKHVRVMDISDIHHYIGKEVKVIHGEFEGVHGRLARVAGQQRVIIQLLDTTCIATAYIPTPFLEFISPP